MSKLEEMRKEWNEYVAFLKEKYPEPENQEWAFSCQHHQRIDDILNGKEIIAPTDEKWPPLTRNAQKEAVESFRKAYPQDQRSNAEIMQRMEDVKIDSRHKRIMFHWAVSHSGFSKEELEQGRLN